MQFDGDEEADAPGITGEFLNSGSLILSSYIHILNIKNDSK